MIERIKALPGTPVLSSSATSVLECLDADALLDVVTLLHPALADSQWRATGVTGYVSMEDPAWKYLIVELAGAGGRDVGNAFVTRVLEEAMAVAPDRADAIATQITFEV